MNNNGSRSMGYNFAIIAFGVLLFVIGLIGIINNRSFRANAVEVECEVTDIVKQGKTGWLANSHAIEPLESTASSSMRSTSASIRSMLLAMDWRHSSTYSSPS